MNYIFMFVCLFSLVGMADDVKPTTYTYHLELASKFDGVHIGATATRRCSMKITRNEHQAYEDIVLTDVVTAFEKTASTTKKIPPGILATLYAQSADHRYLQNNSVEKFELPENNYSTLEYWVEKTWGENKSKKVIIGHELKAFGEDKQIVLGDPVANSIAVQLLQLCNR